MTSHSMRPRSPRSFHTLSRGEKIYRYRHILAKPSSVLLDTKSNTLFITESTTESTSESITFEDLLSARFTAYVVSHVETQWGRKRHTQLYIQTSGNTQVEVSTDITQTTQLVDEWRASRRNQRTEFPWVPASALALAIACKVPGGV